MDEKLAIEVPFNDGERERFLQFVEDEALDMGKFVRKLIIGELNKQEKFERHKEDIKRAGMLCCKWGKPA